MKDIFVERFEPICIIGSRFVSIFRVKDYGPVVDPLDRAFADNMGGKTGAEVCAGKSTRPIGFPGS